MNTIEEDEAPKDAEAGDLIPHRRRHDVKDGQHSVAAPGEGNAAGVDNMLQAVDGITVAEALSEITGVEPAIDKTGRLPRAMDDGNQIAIKAPITRGGSNI